MKVTIICIGKLKENYLKEAVLEYSKRLSRYVKLNIIELSDEKTPDNASLLQEEEIRKKEGLRILGAIKEDMYVVCLEVLGIKISSREFSEFFENKAVRGVSHIAFIIGGSLGLSKEVSDKSQVLFSFSDMTFPHQLMRVILLEQIYRAQRIRFNEPYHK